MAFALLFPPCVTVYVYPFTPRPQRPAPMPLPPPAAPRALDRHYWILGSICFVLAGLIVLTA